MPKTKKEKPQPEQPDVNRKTAGLRSVDEVDLSKIPLGLQELALNQIILSENNPRKKFSESSMKDLIQSVKLHGILQPVLVRPIEFNANTNVWTFELVAGERRYRAAKEANLPLIPAISKLLTDEETAEVQIIENLQREDVHPLDEARGFKRLLSFKNYSVQTIADKLGKSISFVLKRLKLAELNESFSELFYKDEITLGHALHISRLLPEQQNKLFKIMNEDISRFTVQDTRRIIESNFHLYLNKTVFSKTDPNLCKEAGACTVCQKRTGFNTELFDDFVEKDDRCTDPVCFNNKIKAHIEKRIKKAEKSGTSIYKIGTQESKNKDFIKPNDITEIVGGFDEELLDAIEKAGIIKTGIKVETDSWSKSLLGKEFEFVFDSELRELRDKLNKENNSSGNNSNDLSRVIESKAEQLVLEAVYEFYINKLKEVKSLPVDLLLNLLVTDLSDLPSLRDIERVSPELFEKYETEYNLLEQHIVDDEDFSFNPFYQKFTPEEKRNILISAMISKIYSVYHFKNNLLDIGFELAKAEKQAMKDAKKIIEKQAKEEINN